MAFALDLPTIGLATVFVGFILVALALAKRTGDYKRGDVGVVGAVLLGVGFLMAFGSAVLSAVGPAPEEVGPVELWDVRLTSAQIADNTPTTQTAVVAVDGKSADIYGDNTAVDDGASQMTAVLTVINLNIAEFSAQSFQLVFDFVSAPTISDPAAGTSYPMAQPDNADPSIVEILWSGAASGSQIKEQYYTVHTAGSTDSGITAVLDLVEASITAMVSGSTYTVVYSADAESFSINYHDTS